MRISMSKAEIKQTGVMEQLKRGQIKQKTAARLIDRTVRTVRRKLRRYEQFGAEGVIHKLAGKHGNRGYNPNLKKQIITLAETKYAGFGPTFMSEKLRELDGIAINRETLRKFLLEEGLWKKERRRKRRRKWREPKQHYGEMVQLDGSRHLWVDGCNIYWTLVMLIDDATKKTFLRFYQNESYASVVDLTKRYIKKFGKPFSIYTDRGGVFKVNTHNENDDLITQYERALCELDIKLIHAYSPQAKGRVERGFRTHQDRLVKELRLKKIKTMEEANNFLEREYMSQHNCKFTRPAKESCDLHKRCTVVDLDNVFAVISKRTVFNDWTIKYKNKLIQLENNRPAIVRPKDIVMIHEKLDGDIYITIREQKLAFKEIKHKVKPLEYKQPLPHKPHENHPWKRLRACY